MEKTISPRPALLIKPSPPLSVVIIVFVVVAAAAVAAAVVIDRHRTRRSCDHATTIKMMTTAATKSNIMNRTLLTTLHDEGLATGLLFDHDLVVRCSPRLTND